MKRALCALPGWWKCLPAFPPLSRFTPLMYVLTERLRKGWMMQKCVFSCWNGRERNDEGPGPFQEQHLPSNRDSWNSDLGWVREATVIHVVCPCSSANYRVITRGQLVEMKTITKIQILHFLSLFQGMRAQIGSQPKDKCARSFCKTDPCTEERQKPTLAQHKIFLSCNQEIQVTAAISSHTAAVNPGQQDTHTSWWPRAWMLQTAMHF